MSEQRSLTFTIPGPPVPQGRPRFYRMGKGVRVHMEAKDRAYRKVVKEAALIAAMSAEGSFPLDEPIGLRLIFYVPRPKGRAKRFVYPDRKPDLTNLAKAIEDGAIEGIFAVNDSRIVKIMAQKVYSDDPRVEVGVFWGGGE